MEDDREAELPIVRITRMSTQLILGSCGERGKEVEPRRWTVYGVDTEGVERVYVEHNSHEEHQAWRTADPLWHQAQEEAFSRLLQNPRTRDLTLEINIKAALEAGNTEQALELVQCLSAARKAQLLRVAQQGGAETATPEATGNSSGRPERATEPSRSSSSCARPTRARRTP